MDKYTALKKYFGYTSFRNGQEEIIDTILSGRDILAVMPTGAGKSICFQVPALVSEGTAIVISPLISLMKDQISALRENGISAATINSSLDRNQLDRTYKAAAEGKFKLLYVSPERLNTGEFSALAQKLNISAVCVDEAHCVSQWGQDFRSSYLEIAFFIASLKSRPVVAAFTATATGKVREDICNLLLLKNPEIMVTGFDRKNLFFEVQTPADKFTALRKCLDSHISKSCIVYCSTRKTVNEVHEKLQSLGYSVSRYHAGLMPDERKHNQDMFVTDKVKIMVATNAFGMGIDKSDVSLVVHYNMPGDIESYYQEAGRAGRDGSEADCILLFSNDDIRIQKFFINNPSENELIDEEQAEAIKKRKTDMLRCMTAYVKSGVCLRNLILRYFGEKTGVSCGKCSVCCGAKKYTDITQDAQKVLSAAVRTKGKCSKSMLIDVLLGNENECREFSAVKTFGAMKGCSKKYTECVIDCLTENGFLNVSDDVSKGLISASKNANGILFENMRIHMNYERDTEISNKGTKHRHKTASQRPDPVLLALLRNLRKKIADSSSVPPFIIFTDSALFEMSAKKPSSIDEMRKIASMSESKLEKYAPAFLKEILSYIKRD